MTLQEYFKGIQPMSDAKADHIATFFKKETVSKNQLLIAQGKISKESYFLEKGIIRCFIIDLEGNEVTTRFYEAPDFLNDYVSFFKQKPSEEYYEVLTEGVVWSINFENVQHCFHTLPEFREWGRMLLTLNYATLHEKMISFHKYTAQERYLTLNKKHPKIIEKVPLQIIASYLGITKFSLSRIRKELENLGKLS